MSTEASTKPDQPRRTGVQYLLDYLRDPLDNRPDLFLADESGHFTFPCSICTHRNRPKAECKPCRHYTL